MSALVVRRTAPEQDSLSEAVGMRSSTELRGYLGVRSSQVCLPEVQRHVLGPGAHMQTLVTGMQLTGAQLARGEHAAAEAAYRETLEA